MIQQYLCAAILLCSFPLLATNQNDSTNHDTLFDSLSSNSGDTGIKYNDTQAGIPSIQAPIIEKLNEKITYKQYPVARMKKPSESGYFAVNNALAIAQSEEQTGFAQAMTLEQLTNPSVAELLFGQKDSLQRLSVIESRKKELAQDYVKDTLLLNLKGVKKADKNNLLNLLTALAELNLDKSNVVCSDSTEESLKVIAALLPSVVETLNFEIVKTGDEGVTYQVTSDAIVDAIIQRAATLGKATKHILLDQLQQKEFVEQLFTTLSTLEFTIKSEVNKNTLSVVTPTTEQFVRTYASGTSAGTDDEPLDGDWLQTNDIRKLVEREKTNPDTFFQSSKLEKAVTVCLESSPTEATLFSDLQLNVTIKTLVEELKRKSTVFVFVNRDDTWFSCVITKNDNEFDLTVADALNKNRIADPAIVKITEALTFDFDKKEKTPAKPEKKNIVEETTSATGEEKKEKPSYDAPLAHIPLEELPKLEQFFGGKTPNDIIVRLKLLIDTPDNPAKVAKTSIKNCLLLYGPPGTGKSTLAQLIGRMAGWRIIFANCGRFRTPYMGSSYALLKEFFDEALKDPKCLIILDEIDCLGSKLEPHNSTQEDNRAVKVLIDLLDSIRHNPGVYVIATTNYPEKMDGAIARRFYSREVPLPNHQTRAQILIHYLNENGLKIEEGNVNAVSPQFFTALVNATRNFSGDALEDLVATANLYVKAKLAPEENVAMNFWFSGFEKEKPVGQTLCGLAENPYVPLIHYLGGYEVSTLDKHLYSQYKRVQKVRHDIENRDFENDTNAKWMRLKWRHKLKSALVTALSSFGHGVMTSLAGKTVDKTIELSKPSVSQAYKYVKDRIA